MYGNPPRVNGRKIKKIKAHMIQIISLYKNRDDNGDEDLSGLEVMASREASQKPPQFSNNHNFPKIDPKDKN